MYILLMSLTLQCNFFFPFHLFYTEIFRLVQIKTILANSTFNINEIVSKTTSDGDDSTDDGNADDGNYEDDECSGSDDLFEYNETSDLKNVYV